MTAGREDDLEAIFLGPPEVDDPTVPARVKTIASEIVDRFRLAPYVLGVEYGPERVTISAHDRRLRLSGVATFDHHQYLAACEDDEIRREIGRCIGRAISRALEREVVADEVRP